MKLTRLRQLATLATLLLTASPGLRAADGAVSFDGTGQNIFVPNFHNAGVSGEVTVEFWAKTNTDAIQQAAFMLFPDQPANRFQASISYFNGNTYWDCGDINAGGRVSMPNPDAVNKWTHYAFVSSKAGGFMKIYVNGVQTATKGTPVPGFNTAGNGATGYGLYIGGGSGFFLNGSLDEFRVWNVARTAAEIQAKLGGPLIGDEAGLRLYYKFDEGSGNLATNSATATGSTFNGGLFNGTTRSAPALTPYVVTNNADSGPGSLRGTLATAAAASGPALITFAPGLSGQDIDLTTATIEFTDYQGVTIDASSLTGGVTIRIIGSGSVILVTPNRSLTLRGLTLTNGSIGAIENFGTLTLAHCTFYNNNNQGLEGGAIYNQGGIIELTHCTLYNNATTTDGGAIYNKNGTLTLTHCTLAGNKSNVGKGGAIHNRGGTLSLNNCIVAGNSDGAAGTASDNIEGSFTGSNNITSGTALAAGLEVNASGDPVLKSNGGSTWTIALTAGPAVDAGAAMSGLTEDQRGLSRSMDGDGDGQAAPDLGAVELNPVTVLVTTAADELDTTSSAGTGISLREAIRDGTADIIKFSPSLNGQTLTLTRGAEIVIGKSILISTDGLPAGLTVDGGPGTNRLFTVAAGFSVTMNGLNLTGGDGAGAARSSSGGAILNLGSLRLRRCAVFENTATTAGGGIACVSETQPANLELVNCTVYKNTEPSEGGGISLNGGTLTLTHSTVVFNEATYGFLSSAGGISATGSSSAVSVTNSIVAFNFLRTLFGAGPADVLFSNDASHVLSGTNLIQTTGADLIRGSSTLLTSDPRLAPFGNYGGPTKTMPPLPGSPVIDAVSQSGAVTGLAFDQRGFARTRDGDGNGSALPDIGAVELNPLTVTTTEDQLDTTVGGQTSLREAVRDGSQADIFFAPSLSGGTITITRSPAEIAITQGVILDATGLPDGLTIDGGAGNNRIFNVTGTAPVRLTGLTLTGGEAPGGRGGAILTAAGTDVTVSRCTFTANSSLEGGAIFNLGRLALERCTFSGNTGGYGGALQCQGFTTVTHCTIAGNHGSSAGGGIFNKNTTEAAPLTVAHSIVANNTSPLADGRDIFNQLAYLIYDGANNVRSDFDDQSDIYAGINGGSLYRQDPDLAPLGLYGGPTRTMALKPSSPAWNHTTGSTSLSDQRGFPMVGVPDLGAYEGGTINSYPTWSYEKLGEISSEQEDPDKDFRTNFYEYATLTDPLVRNSDSIPTFERNATTGKFTVTIKVRRNQENLIYRIERSTNISSENGWGLVASYDSDSDTLTPTPPTTATMGTDDVITITDDPGTAKTMFYRVKFSILD